MHRRRYMKAYYEQPGKRARRSILDKAAYRRRKDIERQIAQEWVQTHAGLIIALLAAKYQQQRAKLSVLSASWKSRHPEYRQAKCARHNARRRSRARAGDLTAKQWKEICLFYGNACAQCRTSAAVAPLTVDHFIPIARGGTHGWSNVWPLCLPCNQRKHTTVPTGQPPHVAALIALAKENIA